MNSILEMLQRDIIKKILAILFIVIIFYFMGGLINLFLLTFLITFLIHSLQSFIVKHLKRFFNVNRALVAVALYVIMIALIVWFFSRYVPVLVYQIKDIISDLVEFKDNTYTNNITQTLSPFIAQIDVANYMKQGTNYLVKIVLGLKNWGFNIIAAFILSIFFVVEEHQVSRFVSRFEKSRISWFYKYVCYIGTNLVNTFGKVIQAQIIIALINSLLSVLALSIMNFPQLLGLWVMVFTLGLIPVAGVLISLIPLAIIAFKLGGLIKVLYILIMVALLHSLESYFLNPKLMSAQTKLPVFFIFIILIVSEHLMGIWGLLLGIPLFMFLLDLLDVKLPKGK